jgi:hypothetical protein
MWGCQAHMGCCSAVARLEKTVREVLCQCPGQCGRHDLADLAAPDPADLAWLGSAGLKLVPPPASQCGYY